MGLIAQDLLEYEQAEDLYQQSLAIKKELGDQDGQATALHGLGNLAYLQGEDERALMYMIQAYLLFDALQSPNSARILPMITQIRSHVDEETFTTQWRTFAGDRPFPLK